MACVTAGADRISAPRNGGDESTAVKHSEIARLIIERPTQAHHFFDVTDTRLGRATRNEIIQFFIEMARSRIDCVLSLMLLKALIFDLWLGG